MLIKYIIASIKCLKKLKPGSKLSVSENRKIALRCRIASGVSRSAFTRQQKRRRQKKNLPSGKRALILL
jgi:hypothetical protein